VADDIGLPPLPGPSWCPYLVSLVGSIEHLCGVLGGVLGRGGYGSFSCEILSSLESRTHYPWWGGEAGYNLSSSGILVAG
jgi:hypothetical protein